MGKKTDRDLALMINNLLGDIKQALDDLMETMFIIYQPKYFSGNIGDTASFTVVAMNVDTYQWQASSDGGTTWADSTLAGAKTSSISVKISTNNKDRLWRCTLTDINSNVIDTDIVGIIIPD